MRKGRGAFGSGRLRWRAGILFSFVVLAVSQLGASVPAHANTIIFIDDSIDIEIANRFNGRKRYTTLNGRIFNIGPVHSLSRVIANTTVSPVTLFSRQRIFHQQGTLQDNDVIIVNRGSIDPAVGINAQITNQLNLDFFNFADDSNADAGIATVSLGQRLTHYQDHLLANAVIVRSSGPITAGRTGIAAGIANKNFSRFFTDALNNNTHLGALTVDLSQTVTVRQRSRISNVLSVRNSGDIDAGTTGVTTVLFDADLVPLARAYQEFEQGFPRPGWVEHDARAILSAVDATLDEGLAHSAAEGCVAIGITNQRETIFAKDPAIATALPLALANPNVIITRTFSKIDAMAGLRIGYAIGHADTLERMRTVARFGSVTVLSAAAALVSLSDSDRIEWEISENHKVREFTLSAFREMGCHVTDSQTNFVWVDVNRSPEAFREACFSLDVLVGRDFPSPSNTYSRISLGTMEEMRQADTVFEKVLHSTA